MYTSYMYTYMYTYIYIYIYIYQALGKGLFRRPLVRVVGEAPAEHRDAVLSQRGGLSRWRGMMCTYLYIYICVYREREIHIDIYIYICIYISLSLYIYIYMYIDMYRLIHIYAHMVYFWVKPKGLTQNKTM